MSESEVDGSAVEADGTEEDCPAAPLVAASSGMGKGLENGTCVSGSRSGKRLVWLPCGFTECESDANRVIQWNSLQNTNSF